MEGNPRKVIQAKKWATWVDDLFHISKVGLLYSTCIFDTERYQKISDIAAEMAASGSDTEFEKVKEFFY